jgi:hypothetical protein
MKTKFLLVIFSGITFTGCFRHKHPVETSCIFILPDFTDSLAEVQNLSIEQLHKFLPDFKDQPLQGAMVKMLPITDRKYNGRYQASLPPIFDENEHNEIDRKSEIDSFEVQLERTVKQVHHHQIGLQNSYVFGTVFGALRELAECTTCTSKKLFILSDCREKSILFNAYRDVGAIQKNPEKFAALLDTHFPIKKSLTGISISIVHQPATVQEDQKYFDVIVSFLKSYLNAKGGTVTIVTNLN